MFFKKNKLLFLGLAFLLLGLNFGLVYAAVDAKEPLVTKVNNPVIILYYSDECPHCQAVRDFIASNNLVKPTNLVEKEITKNSDNNKELIEILSHKCHMTGNSVDLPVLWDGKTCEFGESNVITFLQNYHAK